MLSTFRTTREAYLADLRISKSQKTYEQYELVLRKFGEWLEQTAAEQTQEQITPLTITAWKQSVAERNLHQLVTRQPPRTQKARTQIRPQFQVVLRVAHKRRLARRPARRVNPRQLPPRHRKKSERIVLPEILLGRERQPLQIIHRPDLIRRDILFRKFPPVKGNLLRLFHRTPQMRGLQPGPVRPAHALRGRIKNPVGYHKL